VNVGDATSQSGEIPLECPDDISFKYLMLMQEELRAKGMVDFSPLGEHRRALREILRARTLV